jgi:queuosine precursor transporter
LIAAEDSIAKHLRKRPVHERFVAPAFDICSSRREHIKSEGVSEIALIALYLVAIVAANLTIAKFGPSATMITSFLFIGLDITTRDRLHEIWRGKNLWLRMAALIASGSLLSWLLNARAGSIAVASFAAFAASGAADALVYHALRKRPWIWKVNGSNVVSAAVDSLVFPTLAFGAILPLIVAGQFIAKVGGGAVWAFVLGSNSEAAGKDSGGL